MTLETLTGGSVRQAAERWLKSTEPPHNGPCDRIHECHYASPQCRKQLYDYSLDWTDWASTPLPAAPSRRWTMCSGWKMTLGMVFDKRSGSWVYTNILTREILDGLWNSGDPLLLSWVRTVVDKVGT